MKIPPPDNKEIYDYGAAKRLASDGLYDPVRSFDRKYQSWVTTIWQQLSHAVFLSNVIKYAYPIYHSISALVESFEQTCDFKAF
jgi:hypothetical protein